jgi:hypothetical protein
LELWNLRVEFDESGAEKEDRKVTGERAEEGAIAGRAIGDEAAAHRRRGRERAASERRKGEGRQGESSGFFWIERYSCGEKGQEDGKGRPGFFIKKRTGISKK